MSKRRDGDAPKIRAPYKLTDSEKDALKERFGRLYETDPELAEAIANVMPAMQYMLADEKAKMKEAPTLGRDEHVRVLKELAAIVNLRAKQGGAS